MQFHETTYPYCAYRYQHPEPEPTVIPQLPSTTVGGIGLDVGRLDTVVQQLFSARLTPAILRSYRSTSQKQILQGNKLALYPVIAKVLCQCVADLYEKCIAGYVVRGPKKTRREGEKCIRLPITPEILLGLLEIWEKQSDAFDGLMLGAEAYTCFVGFLRTGEVVVPSEKEYDPSVHMSVGDVKQS